MRDTEGGPGSGRYPAGSGEAPSNEELSKSQVNDTNYKRFIKMDPAKGEISKVDYVVATQLRYFHDKGDIVSKDEVSKWYDEYQEKQPGKESDTMRTWTKTDVLLIRALESAPPGMEKVVKSLKKSPSVDNPFAVAWSMKDKEAKSEVGGGQQERPDEEKARLAKLKKSSKRYDAYGKAKIAGKEPAKKKLDLEQPHESWTKQDVAVLKATK